MAAAHLPVGTTKIVPEFIPLPRDPGRGQRIRDAARMLQLPREQIDHDKLRDMNPQELKHAGHIATRYSQNKNKK